MLCGSSMTLWEASTNVTLPLSVGSYLNKFLGFTDPLSIDTAMPGFQNVPLRKYPAIKMFTQLNFQSHFQSRWTIGNKNLPLAKKRKQLSSIVLPSQVIYQRQDSWDVHKPLLPTVEKFTSGRAHIQHMTDKYINEANLMTEKTDLWGKIVLNKYIHMNCF